MAIKILTYNSVVLFPIKYCYVTQNSPLHCSLILILEYIFVSSSALTLSNLLMSSLGSLVVIVLYLPLLQPQPTQYP